MRTLSLVFASVAMLIAGTAAAEPSGDPFDRALKPIPSDRTMSADEVNKYALPYLPRVSRCYRTHAMPDRRATGELELYLVIARNGSVVHIDIAARGVPVLRLGYLEKCLRKDIATWQFPTRKGFTNATIPYYFLHTKAPKAGPFESCWKVNGCPERHEVPREI